MEELTLLKGIKEICFKDDIWKTDRSDIHKKLLLEIKQYLSQMGLSVKLESAIIFDYLKLKTNEIISRSGFIDLVGYNKNESYIAIEFDSGHSLKYKSIEKLLQMNTNIKVGIVMEGGKLYENISRINKTRERLKNQEKIALLNIKYKTIHII